MDRHVLRVAVLGVTLLGVAGVGNAASYVVTELSPTAGFDQAGGTSIDGGVVGGYLQDSNFNQYAAVWTASTGWVNVNPAGSAFSNVTGVSGTTKVGFIAPTGTSTQQAVVWTGAGNSYSALPSVGFTDTSAAAVAGAYIVGTGDSKAIAWKSTGGSYSGPIDLHAQVTALSSSFSTSGAYATDGSTAVGFATLDSSALDSGSHAIAWNLTTSTSTDLQAGTIYTQTVANGVAGNMIGGIGTDPNSLADHALLWTTANGSTWSVTDLNGTYDSSDIFGMSSVGEVGDVVGVDGQSHAYIWFGTVESGIDLQQYLSSNYVSSVALGVDEYGNIVGDAFDANGGVHAVTWTVPGPATPLPEPMSLAVLSPIGAFLFGKRLMRKRKEHLFA